MAAEPYFLTHEFSERFRKSYKQACDQLQKQVLGTVQKLIDDPTRPGWRHIPSSPTSTIGKLS
jgi:hypothetical protein